MGRDGKPSTLSGTYNWTPGSSSRDLAESDPKAAEAMKRKIKNKDFTYKQ